MRTASKWVLVSAVALCMAGMASAQGGGGRGGRGGQGGAGQGRGGFGMGGGNIGVAMLLANEGVQKELKATDEQKTKIKEFTDAQTAKMREAFGGGGGGGAPDPEKMAEVRKAATEAADKFVKDTLNADQQKRIKQITYQVQLQMMGPAALSSDDTAKALSLTDDQKGKLKTLADEMRKDRQELQQDARGNSDAATEARKKIQTITKEYTAKAVDTLTADQKKAWAEMTGEKFEYTPAQMGGRGGRGGAGGGGQGGGRGGRGGNNPPPPPPV